MRLPNAEYATVDRRKLVDYLLARSHPMGCSKAVWFEAFGFSAENWPQLAAALAKHACRQPVVSSMGTPYGAKFIVEGPLP